MNNILNLIIMTKKEFFLEACLRGMAGVNSARDAMVFNARNHVYVAKELTNELEKEGLFDEDAEEV